MSLRSPLFLAVVLGAAALGGAAISHAVPGEGGTISACYGGQLGPSLRPVDNNQACNPGEGRLSWSQQGAPGPQGSAGPVGPPGPAGQQGPAGQIPAPVATKLVSDLAADRRQVLVANKRLLALAGKVHRLPADARAAQIRAAMEQMARQAALIARLMAEHHQVSMNSIRNQRG